MTYGKSVLCVFQVARKHTVKWTDEFDLLNELQAFVNILPYETGT